MNSFQSVVPTRGLNETQAMQIPFAIVRCRTHEQSLRYATQDCMPLPFGTIQIPTGIRPITANGPKGIYDAYVKTCQRWNLSRSQQIALLGFPENSIIGFRVLNGQLLRLQPDQEDRARYIVGISLGLGTLFGESIDAELNWLNQPRQQLDGKSPLNYMFEGHMTNLLTIIEMVKQERGL